jgi:tetratricopeptide (TPR) repeat protein
MAAQFCLSGIGKMNDNEPILAELRKISAWVDFQRKMIRWSLIGVGFTILAGIAVGFITDHEIKKDLSPNEKPDWYQVDQNVRTGDFDEAIRIGEELTQKTPQYPEAHRRLAGAYLAAGKIGKAREHYAEAFRLFPSEENEKLVLTIDKRIQAENPKP